MVGFVTGRGQARIALDVGQDIVFFNNPDLPETRSEITLPLRVSDHMFGVLDVQSTMPKAFDTSDIALLSTLANQVAIAIENARLIDEAQRSVRELELSQRLFIHQEWSKLLEEHTPEGFQYILGKLIPLSSKDTEEIGIVPKAPTVVFEHPSGNGGNEGVGLMVPITLRGETIGLIELGETINTRRWSNDEINLVSSIAEQVGLALEYARLLETTRRRAERERLVSEITTSLRATNDPQQILETAVTQLKHALRVQSVKVHVVSEAGGNEQDSNIGSQDSDQQDPSS
jgi:GAF domain-containing protein